MKRHRKVIKMFGEDYFVEFNIWNDEYNGRTIFFIGLRNMPLNTSAPLNFRCYSMVRTRYNTTTRSDETFYTIKLIGQYNYKTVFDETLESVSEAKRKVIWFLFNRNGDA